MKKLNFWKKLILTYSDDSSKNGVWFKLHKYLTNSPTDYYELYNAWQQAKMNLEKKPDILVVDNGYLNDEVLEKPYQEKHSSNIPDRNEVSKFKVENMKKQIFQSQFSIRFQKKRHLHPPHKDPFCSIKTIANLMAYGTKYKCNININ